MSVPSPSLRSGSRRPSNNPNGANGLGKQSILKQYPDLPEIIQGHLNDNVRVKDLPEILLDENDITISLSSIERIMRQMRASGRIVTARTSTLPAAQAAAEIIGALEDDPLGRHGSRAVIETLKEKGVHLKRAFVLNVLRTLNPDAVAARHPRTRRVHQSALWSAGPDEEWCMDGHEKLALSMRLSIFGNSDKYSRKELRLRAVPSPNGRNPMVPVAVHVETMHKAGGCPMQSTSDMGTENGPIGSMQTNLRVRFAPALDPRTFPPHVYTKSIYNITRERAWRPLFEKVLANIEFKWKAGQVGAGFHPEDPIHDGVAYWLWGKIVQEHLDAYVVRHGKHRVRKQKRVAMPTGGRRKDFYNHPEWWGGHRCLIPIPQPTLDRLKAQFVDEKLFQFGSDEMVQFASSLYARIGSPKVSVKRGWKIFALMMAEYYEHV